MSLTPVLEQRVALALIDAGDNVRELDPAHVDALAGSIALRGLIVPLAVRPVGERFVLVAGHHRHAACVKLDLQEVPVTVRADEGSSADSAAENVVRKQLSPLEEARAVRHMLDEGFTLDGAAGVLGWSRALVSARAKILELPAGAQDLLGTGALPVGAVDGLLRIGAVAPALVDAICATVAAGELAGAQVARDPAWALGQALRHTDAATFAAYLSVVHPRDVTELRLGKKAEALLAEAEQLHGQLDRYAYGPPAIRFAEADVDQARAAGVLVEFERGAPIICDRPLYRQLVKQAIARTVDELRERKQARDSERAQARAGGRERTPRDELDAEHRAALREFTQRAHGVNLDLGAALLRDLAVVAPDDLDVARFFAYGLLGRDTPNYLGTDDHAARTIAATGLRLVLGEFRDTQTPTLKSGQPGKTKVAYGDVDAAQAWLWRFVDGARTAGELFGWVMVVFAAQHYAHDLVLPRAQRRASVLPASRKDTARKAFERATKRVLPASWRELGRALEREARTYERRQAELDHAQAGQQPDAAEAGGAAEVDDRGEDLGTDELDELE